MMRGMLLLDSLHWLEIFIAWIHCDKVSLFFQFHPLLEGQKILQSLVEITLLFNHYY